MQSATPERAICNPLEIAATGQFSQDSIPYRVAISLKRRHASCLQNLQVRIDRNRTDKPGQSAVNRPVRLAATSETGRRNDEEGMP